MRRISRRLPVENSKNYAMNVFRELKESVFFLLSNAHQVSPSSGSRFSPSSSREFPFFGCRGPVPSPFYPTLSPVSVIVVEEVEDAFEKAKEAQRFAEIAAQAVHDTREQHHQLATAF